MLKNIFEGGGPLGHPKVYINLDKPGPQACGYCKFFFLYSVEKVN